MHCTFRASERQTGRMSLDVARLDAFSARLAELLFSRHPEWQGYAQAVLDGVAFEVNVPSPVDASWVLWLSSENEEVTVGFDRWHGHYGRWGADATDAYREGLEMVDAILKEECAARVFFRSENWIGSEVVGAGDGLDDGITEWRQLGATRMYRRSWLGSLNSERQLSSP